MAVKETQKPAAEPGESRCAASFLPNIWCRTRCPELSELEFGLIIASHAFGRWMTRCMAGAGVKDMTETEILVVHHVNHRGREKKLADICFVLNIEDTHVVSYA
jgi:predicted MarR family transcription regulator